MNLREARIEAGLTQRELARRVGCTASYISGIEIGRDKAGAALVVKILDALNGSAVPAIQYSPPDIPFENEKQKADLKRMLRERGYGTDERGGRRWEPKQSYVV